MYFFLTYNAFLKKYNLVKTTLKNLIQKKKLDMTLLTGPCLQDVHFMKEKINLVITKEKIVLKNYVKIKRKCNGNN